MSSPFLDAELSVDLASRRNVNPQEWERTVRLAQQAEQGAEAIALLRELMRTKALATVDASFGTPEDFEDWEEAWAKVRVLDAWLRCEPLQPKDGAA